MFSRAITTRPTGSAGSGDRSEGAITSEAHSNASKAASDAARAALDLKRAGPKNAAEVSRAQSEAIQAQIKVDEARANAALATMAPNSNLHGEAYFDAIISPKGSAF